MPITVDWALKNNYISSIPVFMTLTVFQDHSGIGNAKLSVLPSLLPPPSPPPPPPPPLPLPPPRLPHRTKTEGGGRVATLTAL